MCVVTVINNWPDPDSQAPGNLTLVLTDRAGGLNPTGVFVTWLKGTQEVTSQTSTQAVQFVLWPQRPQWPHPSVTDWSTSLCVDERRASQIGRFAGSVTPAAQQGKADRKHAVANGSRVGSRAGEQEKEELQVWQQEDRRPHPDRKWWQARADALRPAVGERRSRGAGPTFLHVLQTEAVNLKDVIHRSDAEEQVESHTHPSHPLTEVHHPPYCRENNQYSINNQYNHQYCKKSVNHHYIIPFTVITWCSSPSILQGQNNK